VRRVKEVEVNVTSAWKRLGVLLLLGAALVWVLFHLWAQVRGTRMANVVGDAEHLKTALAYDPGQAEVHTRLGFYYLYDPFLFDPPQAVQHFEAAVEIQPFDWNAWSNLGRAYEQQGDVARAERAYLFGIELAPHYFYPRWAYGNFLLRRGEIDRAFRELRRASDIHPQAIGNICDLIWQTTGGNAEVLVQFGTSLRTGSAKGAVSQCLMARAEYQRAVNVWKTLTRDDPAKIDTGRSLVSWLTGAGQWPLAYLVWQEVVREEFKASGEVSPADLMFWNGDFDYDMAVGGFDWSINSSQEVEARLDTVERYRGNQSLLLEFKQHQRVNFSGVTHDLWVEPSTRYRLRFYYKTEKVPETNGLAVVLTDVESLTRFSFESKQLGNESQWTRKEITFETPAETRILRLQIVRRPVGQIYDYIKGRVWFDSFSLEPAPLEITDSPNRTEQ